MSKIACALSSMLVLATPQFVYAAATDRCGGTIWKEIPELTDYFSEGFSRCDSGATSNCKWKTYDSGDRSNQDMYFDPANVEYMPTFGRVSLRLWENPRNGLKYSGSILSSKSSFKVASSGPDANPVHITVRMRAGVAAADTGVWLYAWKDAANTREVDIAEVSPGSNNPAFFPNPTHNINTNAHWKIANVDNDQSNRVLSTVPENLGATFNNYQLLMTTEKLTYYLNSVVLRDLDSEYWLDDSIHASFNVRVSMEHREDFSGTPTAEDSANTQVNKTIVDYIRVCRKTSPLTEAERINGINPQDLPPEY